MRTDRAATRPNHDPVAMGPIVDRQTTVKTLPSLAVGKNGKTIGNRNDMLAISLQECIPVGCVPVTR